jgi:uroporphyrin-III C-methyltransferase
MGLSKLPLISEQLSVNGLAANTPAAIIERGCQKTQRVFTTTLSELSNVAQEHDLQSPSLVVVGHVVSFAEPMHWFGSTLNNSAVSDAYIDGVNEMQMSA